MSSGKVSALAVDRGRACAHCQYLIQTLNAFTAVTAERARNGHAQSTSRRQDVKKKYRSPACRSRSRTCSTSPGLPTLAGSKINRDQPPAAADAALIERLEAAGAMLVGALNMGEYAYDFTGENVHDGPSRNPHDTARMTGGSSGGSGGAVGRRAGAAGAGLRHQRLDPGAVLAVRVFRAEADLWTADARAAVSRSSRASIIWGRSRARRRSGAGL